MIAFSGAIADIARFEYRTYSDGGRNAVPPRMHDPRTVNPVPAHALQGPAQRSLRSDHIQALTRFIIAQLQYALIVRAEYARELCMLLFMFMYAIVPAMQ